MICDLVRAGSHACMRAAMPREHFIQTYRGVLDCFPSCSHEILNAYLQSWQPMLETFMKCSCNAQLKMGPSRASQAHVCLLHCQYLQAIVQVQVGSTPGFWEGACPCLSNHPTKICTWAQLRWRQSGSARCAQKRHTTASSRNVRIARHRARERAHICIWRCP